MKFSSEAICQRKTAGLHKEGVFMKRLFGRNKQANTKSYDPEVMIPAIRCSICTGEQVAGFRDRVTGDFHELYVIRNEADIDAFRRKHGIDGPIEKFY